jgi:hypothetical protein
MQRLAVLALWLVAMIAGAVLAAIGALLLLRPDGLSFG